jgi:hypothetical protein
MISLFIMPHVFVVALIMLLPLRLLIPSLVGTSLVSRMLRCISFFFSSLAARVLLCVARMLHTATLFSLRLSVSSLLSWCILELRPLALLDLVVQPLVLEAIGAGPGALKDLPHAQRLLTLLLLQLALDLHAGLAATGELGPLDHGEILAELAEARVEKAHVVL